MNATEKVIISVCEGKIQGFKNKSAFSAVEFYSFLGVPYGQSTGGYARFKDPVEVKPWKHILNATTEKGGCLQFQMNKRTIDGSEDCLYNNIYTPRLPQKNDEQPLKTVIVCIHPGSHHTGSPDPGYFGSPDFVMHNDIVYVCISFRLHILGYLNLGLKECSGNQALKDIILSLQWIQKNIRSFGGDPNNVTLLGSSSGASMVNHLITSPRTKGLYHKAVLMGSYKYSPVPMIRGENSTIAFELAKSMGYSGSDDKKKLLLFYKKLDITNLIFLRPDRFLLESTAKGYAPIHAISPFTLTYDFGDNPVIPAVSKQKDLETLTRIPLLIGFCEREAAMGFLRPFMKHTMENFYKSIRQNFWGWGSKLNDRQLKRLQNRIESFYMNGKSIETASLSLKCDIQTDIVLSDLYTALINVVAADLPSSVYVYKFQFEGNVNKLKDLYNFVFEEPLSGTFHGDDYTYWSRLQFAYERTEDPLTPETEKIVKTFTKFISTFAKTGNPNYEGLSTQWNPTTVENPCYMSINNDLRLVDGKLNGNRMEFWENLKKEFESNDSSFI